MDMNNAEGIGPFKGFGIILYETIGLLVLTLRGTRGYVTGYGTIGNVVAKKAELFEVESDIDIKDARKRLGAPAKKAVTPKKKPS